MSSRSGLLSSMDWKNLANLETNILTKALNILNELTVNYENGGGGYPDVMYAISLATDQERNRVENEERIKIKREETERIENEELNRVENEERLEREELRPESPNARRQKIRSSWEEFQTKKEGEKPRRNRLANRRAKRKLKY
jgi:hypothetical protein